VIKKNGHSLEHIAFEGKPARRPKFVQSPEANQMSGLDQDPLHAFIARVLDLAGLPGDAYRAAPMHRRLSACLRTLKAESLSEAWILLQNPGSVAIAIDSLLIGVTEFFRDKAVFDALRKIIAANFPNQMEPIRVWSAGCSNGAELYSLAMLLAEAGQLDPSILVGSDCRAVAIQEAKAGLFSEASVQSIDASLRQKYLRRAGIKWQIADSLRRRIEWRECNLLSGGEDGLWDIILWRNMAIYLKMKPAAQVWAGFKNKLRPGGLLVVGKAERPPASSGLTCISRCIYQMQQKSAESAGC
jgi:chemotaxis protein methyltransferase CheR